MIKGLKKLTAGLLSASIILAQAAIPVFAEGAVSDGVILDIDFDKYESLSDMPSGFASPSQGAGETQMELAEDGGNGKVLKITRAKGSSDSFVIQQPIENGTIDPEKDYLFSYKFKAEGSGWYGDFINLLGGSNENIVKTAVFNTFLKVDVPVKDGEEAGITNICDGKIGNGIWVTMDVTIHPSTKLFDVKATVEYPEGTKEEYATNRQPSSNFAKFSFIKLKSNPNPSVDTSLYIDYISLRQLEDPEATPTPAPTPMPGVLYEWNFNNCTADADIPSGWQYNQNDYTTRLIADDKGGKAIKYEKPAGSSTEIKVENTFGKIPVDPSSGDLYEYSFRFKTDGTCFYGDFGKLLASNAADIIKLNLYNGSLRIWDKEITGEVGKQDGWMTLKAVINPKESSLDAYIDYEINSEPVHKELKNVSISNMFSDIATIKFKRNAGAEAIGFALDDIYIRKIEAEPKLEAETKADKTKDLSASGEGKAMSFVTTISNRGTAAGQLNSIQWNVTSDSVTKSSDKFALTTILIDPGAAASIVLVVDGLCDENAEAAAVIE